MQQFTVPQFIDVEDKIIGPITTRQFLIMMVTFIVIAVCYKLFDLELFVVVGLFLFILGGIFSFLKINGRPFHFFILNFVETLKKPYLRIWNHALDPGKYLDTDKINNIVDTKAKAALIPAEYKYYTRSRLAELSLIVDTRGEYGGERDEGKEISAY